jgi:hypothetical protein
MLRRFLSIRHFFKNFMSNSTSPDHFLLPAADHPLPVTSSILKEKRGILGTCIVLRATLCKRRGHAHHEFVVLEVLVPLTGNPDVCHGIILMMIP